MLHFGSTPPCFFCWNTAEFSLIILYMIWGWIYSGVGGLTSIVSLYCKGWFGWGEGFEKTDIEILFLRKFGDKSYTIRFLSDI